MGQKPALTAKKEGRQKAGDQRVYLRQFQKILKELQKAVKEAYGERLVTWQSSAPWGAGRRSRIPTSIY